MDAWNIQWGFTEPGTSEMQPCGAEFIGQWHGWHNYDQRFKYGDIIIISYLCIILHHFLNLGALLSPCLVMTIALHH